jgi:Xaa-Pro aminopeptidase
MASSERYAQLATAIAQAGLDLYLVPMVDEFQGEYIPAYAARLPYITGFTGSAGMGVFHAAADTGKKHALFVDGRYTLQAPGEVNGEHITVVNSGDTGLADWLIANAPAGARIGFDPWLITEQQREGWSKATANHSIQWVPIRGNLVDGIWPDQPTPPAGAVQLHPLALAGQSYAEKRGTLLANMGKQKAQALVLTQSDSINWLLNIRGDDVPYNPLLLAHMLLQADGSATLYTHPHTFTAEVSEYLAAERVTVMALAEVFSDAIALPAGTIMLDPAATAHGWFALAQSKGCDVIRAEDPAQLPKALKNTAELEGIRAAHLRDGLALVRFLHWFDTQASNGKFPDELTVVERLEQFRAMDASYRGPSFATIAGSGPNGAIVHYRADTKSNRRTRAGELFLLDSGGQYADGTTDVTRTLFVSSPAGGAPAPQVREIFTRVLKGHITLGAASFPAGTSGVQMDVLARHALWSAGLDYDHGTGHGVGAYLCVHEGPQRISKRGSAMALQPGMVISNEPGYYAAGQFGIRIESLVAVTPRGTMADGKPMLGFETLTLAPIDARLIDVALLSMDERNWLNAYHRRVYEAHAPQLDDKVLKWLAQATRAI